MIIRAVAGALVTLGVLLAWLITPYWLLLPAFVGINLFQSAFSHYCPLERMLNSKNSTEKG